MFNIIKKILLITIKSYQFCISPFFAPSCRFYPTCSQYAYQAISAYGVFKGSYLFIRRILKCHPFSNSSGFDPVPKN